MQSYGYLFTFVASGTKRNVLQRNVSIKARVQTSFITTTDGLKKYSFYTNLEKFHLYFFACSDFFNQNEHFNGQSDIRKVSFMTNPTVDILLLK